MSSMWFYILYAVATVRASGRSTASSDIVGTLSRQDIEAVGLRSAANIPDTEMQALNDLYVATNGASWVWQNDSIAGIPWNFSETANPCTDHWQGINCTFTPPYEFYHVSQLSLIGYNLDGSLPASLDGLTQLNNLRLSSNSLDGTLPATIGNLSALKYLYLDENGLVGHIPPQLGKLTQLQYMYLDHNYFSGSIPSALGSMSALEFLMVYNNQLSGTIPASLGNLSRLTNLYMDHNYLMTGSIPHSLGQLNMLQNFDVSCNLLTGSIPPSFGALPQLHSLYLHTNYFSGSIPSELGNVSTLENVDLSVNLFTGSIPSSLSAYRDLRQLLFQYNLLVGSLEGIVDPTVQNVLTTIQVNHNALTGTLPKEIFQLSQLSAFVAVSNCFTGSIPSYVCDGSALISLVLDGLSSAPACRHTLLGGLASSYSISQAVSGSIPSCLFQLPVLATLHLSGNGLTGSLELGSGIRASLTDLSASHNLLTGSIPRVLQQRQWSNLDLSYNRLTGTLFADFASGNAACGVVDAQNRTQAPNSTSLSLENNRLSGAIAASIVRMVNVSVLGSNVFSCALDGSDLPRHDNGRNNYQCSSVAFDMPYYIWLCLVGVLLAVLVALWKRGDKLAQQFVWLAGAVGYVRKGYTIISEGVVDVVAPRMQAFLHTLDVLCRLSFWSTCYMVALLLTIYPVLSYYYGTLTYSYAWSVSAAYNSGSVPVALEMLIYVALLCGIWALFTRTFVAPSASSRPLSLILSRSRSVVLDLPTENLTMAALYGTFVALNVLVVVGVNIAYVYVVIYKGTVLTVISQILLSFFKLFWNNLYSAYLLKVLVAYFTRCGSISKGISGSTGANPGPKEYSEFDYFSLRLFVALLNNIAVPCVVIAGISPSCFYNVFVDAPTVTSTYTVSKCQGISTITGVCDHYSNSLMTTSYNPPFSYSYQCSSSLVTYYSPAFVFLCMTSSFVTPAAQFVLQQLHKRSRPGSYWSRLTLFLLPRILKPLGPVRDRSRTLSGRLWSGQSDPSVQGLEPDESEEEITQSFDRCLNPTRVLVTLMTYLGMILTFGVVFPPLAVALTVTVVVIVCFVKIDVAVFLKNARSQSQYAQEKYVGIIEKECRGVGSAAVLRTALWMLISFSCCFYALFLFDTLGDAVGFERAYWVLIVMPLMPLVMYAAFAAWNRFRDAPFTDTRSASATVSTDTATDSVGLSVEMKALGTADAPTFSPLGQASLASDGRVQNIQH